MTKKDIKSAAIVKTRDASSPQFYRPSIGGLDDLPPLSYPWTAFFLISLLLGMYDIVSSYILLLSVDDKTCIAKFASAPRIDARRSPLKSMAIVALVSCASIQIWIFFFAIARFRRQCNPFSWTKLRKWANGMLRFKNGDELETLVGRIMFRFAFVTMFTQDLLQLIILYYQQYAAQTPYSFIRASMSSLDYYYYINNQIKGIISGVSFSITWAFLIDKFLCASKRHLKSSFQRCCKSFFRNLCYCINLSIGLLSILICAIIIPLALFRNDGNDIVIEYDITINSYSFVGIGVDIQQQFNYSAPTEIDSKSTTLYYNKQKLFEESLFSKRSNDTRIFDDSRLEGYEYSSAHYYNCVSNILSPDCETDLPSYASNGTAMIVMFTDIRYPKSRSNVQPTTGFLQDYQKYAKYYYFDINFQNISACKIGL